MNGNQERRFFDPQELDYQEPRVREYLRTLIPSTVDKRKNFLTKYISPNVQAGGTANVYYRTDQPHKRVLDSLLQAEVNPSVTFGGENYSFKGEPRFNLQRFHRKQPQEWGGEQSFGSRGFDYRGGDYTARMPNLGLFWNQRTGAPDSFSAEAPMFGGLLSGQITPKPIDPYGREEDMSWMLNFMREF